MNPSITFEIIHQMFIFTRQWVGAQEICTLVSRYHVAKSKHLFTISMPVIARQKDRQRDTHTLTLTHTHTVTHTLTHTLTHTHKVTQADRQIDIQTYKDRHTHKSSGPINKLSLFFQIFKEYSPHINYLCSPCPPFSSLTMSSKYL